MGLKSWSSGSAHSSHGQQEIRWGMLLHIVDSGSSQSSVGRALIQMSIFIFIKLFSYSNDLAVKCFSNYLVLDNIQGFRWENIWILVANKYTCLTDNFHLLTLSIISFHLYFCILILEAFYSKISNNYILILKISCNSESEAFNCIDH